MQRGRRDAQTRVAELVRRIERNPAAPELDKQIRDLSAELGEWVLDAITDRLTAGESYPQRVQDRIGYLQLRAADNYSISVVPLDGELDAKMSVDVMSILTQLIIPEADSIPRIARLSRIERDVWDYWLKGYTPPRMAAFLMKPDRTHYQADSIVRILRRVQFKIMHCPEIGWRTVYAQDQARGPRLDRPPMLWSQAGFIIRQF